MRSFSYFFFFNDTATTEIYTLSLHDALPISFTLSGGPSAPDASGAMGAITGVSPASKKLSSNATRTSAISPRCARSEEHTSELQSPCNLVCRLLLEKKKNNLNVSIATSTRHE